MRAEGVVYITCGGGGVTKRGYTLHAEGVVLTKRRYTLRAEGVQVHEGVHIACRGVYTLGIIIIVRRRIRYSKRHLCMYNCL